MVPAPPDTDRPHHEDIREGLGITAAGSAVNLVLVALKLVVGMAGGSRALVADGIHSMADLVTDAIVFAGLLVGNKPEDEDHHYGHGKVEQLAEMALGMILIGAGVFIAADAARALLLFEGKSPSLMVLPVAAASVLLKEILYHLTIRVARKTGRPSLVANAWHHRSDALSSIGVLAGAGLAVMNPKLAVADALVGFAVAIIVVRMGWKVTWAAGMRIIDTAPSGDYMSRMEQMILDVPGTRSVRNLKMRYVGRLIAVEVHLGLDPEITVRAGHDIAVEVKKEVMSKDKRIFDVLVHVEPEERPAASR
jgi:cation diffusion facilitator family transporter